MVRKLLLLTIFVFAGFSVAGLIITRDTDFSHPALIEAKLPPLIPTRAFYSDPRSEYNYIASSDGAYTISSKSGILGRSKVVRDVKSHNIIAEFPNNLRNIRWHPTESKLRFVYEGDDWEADPLNPERENWIRTSPVQLSGGWQINQYATTADEPVLFLGRSSDRGVTHLWHVTQDGLEAKQIAEGTEKTQSWALNQKGEAKLRIDFRDGATRTILREADGEWDELFVLDLNDIFSPVSKIDADGKLLVRSSRGRDKAALVSFDTNTAEETVLVSNPGGDVGFTTSLTYGGPPDILRLGFDTLEMIALTDRGQVFLNIINDFPKPVTLGFTSGTPSRRYVTTSISPQGKSWIYLLIDLQQSTYKILDEFHFRRFKDHLTQGVPVTFPARDGVEIPAILTMPGEVAEPIPFIVYVHGGPAEREELGYNHEVQFLVNRGYGVLSVNFRGSAGFGKQFQAKGFKEFGRAMQDDITDAARWLVAQGIADTDALAVMGASYGGYAAAMAMTRDPGLFDAAIVEFPMLNIEFQSKYHPGYWNDGINSWWRYFGQIDNPDELELMRQYSPVNQVDNLHGPLLVLAGIRDQIIAIQQIKDFERAAREAGKDVDAHYFPNAGHGTRHWRDNLKRARLHEDFLARQLGGRSGGFEFAEKAPEFID